MVPATYHSFFGACASVAGALIGLLFVAISVSPHKLSGEDAAFGFQARAGVAFSALVDSLLMSLVALLPGNDIGWEAIAFGIAGISSSTALLLMATFRYRREPTADRGRLLLTLLIALYAAQLVNGVVMVTGPRGLQPVDDQAIILLVLFGVGIARSWELVGGSEASSLKILRGAVVQRRQATDTTDQDRSAQS